MFGEIFLILPCLFLSSHSSNSTLVIRARRQNCGSAGYCGNRCCFEIRLQPSVQDSCCNELQIPPRCICSIPAEQQTQTLPVTTSIRQPATLIPQQLVQPPVEVVQQPIQVVQQSSSRSSCICNPTSPQDNPCGSPCLPDSRNLCCIFISLSINPCCISQPVLAPQQQLTQHLTSTTWYTTVTATVTATAIPITTPLSQPVIMQQTAMQAQSCICSSTEASINPCCIEIQLPPLCRCILPATDSCCYPNQQITNICGSCAAPQLQTYAPQTTLSTQIPMQCVPVCQPICQSSCVENYNSLQSQYGDATVPCDAQACICPSGYVKCAEQTCCLRYRYTLRKTKRRSH